MRPRSLVVAAVVIAAAAVCVRLGFWQLSRLDEKRRLNAAQREMLARPPIGWEDRGRGTTAFVHRVASVLGRFDERHQVLVIGIEREGEPGVHVVAPLRLADGAGTVLVDRGWLPAADGVHARPQDDPVPGVWRIDGIAAPLSNADAALPARTIESDSLTLYTVERLDLGALSKCFPYPIDSYYVRALPAPDAPPWPKREPPEPYDETMHLSYAVQWFSFAAILLIGPAALAYTRRGRAAGSTPQAGRARPA